MARMKELEEENQRLKKIYRDHSAETCCNAAPPSGPRTALGIKLAQF